MTVNTPFLIDQPDKVWFIEQGGINIYTTTLKNNLPEGKRFYFFNCGRRQIIMGFEPSPEQEIALLADASEDTTLYELDREAFRQLMQDEHLKDMVAQLVNHWAETLFLGVSENANHPNLQADVLVEADEMLILRKGEKIASQRNLIWAKISASKLDAIQINGSQSIQSSGKDLMIPIIRRSFLQSSRNVGMRFFTSQEALLQDFSWEGLRALDQTVLALEKAEINLIQTNEKQRLQAKYQYQFEQTARTLQAAQAILNPNEANKYLESLLIDTKNPLFNACQVVCNALKIRLKETEEFNEIDPIGDICRIAKIRYRAVNLNKNWWKNESGALLGFLKEQEEPIALMPIKGNQYEAYNPQTQETFVINAQNAQQIDALAYTFYKPFPEKPIQLWDILQFGLAKDYKDFYLLLFMGFSATFLGLLTPILTGLLFDEVIPHASHYAILQVGGALLMVLMGALLFELTENYALLRLETKMDMRLQVAVWDRLLDLPVNFFRQFNTGDLAERAMGINEIRKMLSGVVVTSILGSVFSLLNFILLFYYNFLLALVAFGMVIMELLMMYLIGRWQISKESMALELEGKTQGIVLQLLTGIAKFRVTGTEIRAYTHWLRYFTKTKQYAFQAHQIQNLQSVLNVTMPLISMGLIYILLMNSPNAQQMSTGSFLAFLAAYGAFTSAMLAMSASLLTVFQIFPIYQRTKPILENLPESDSTKANPGKLKGNIEVSQVHFRYSPDTPLILQDVSLKLDSGDYVAFVGASGSGKSTLIRLLLGFEKAESGSIFLDNQELGQLDIRLVRRQIGTVLQDGNLTPGDILSNIIGSSIQLTIEDAWEAAKLAAFDEDVKKMPMGMHTLINEGGSTLSGGQKQRLLIAQTLVHKPRILIFDEATSALDNQTQAIVTQSLHKLQATRIVIAHRLSTIKNVDKIFVFDKGKIVQVGTFEELLAVEGVFRDLASRQME